MSNLTKEEHARDSTVDGEIFNNGEDFEEEASRRRFPITSSITFHSDAAMATMSVRHLDDSITIDRSKESFQFRPHSELFHLCPGEAVVTVGHYFKKPFDFMAASRKFSLPSCELDCSQLFTANCKISKRGIGGPIINYHGEVIGVNFYDELCTPFLPMNIVSKCSEYFKNYGKFCRLRLGMGMINLYSASLGKMEKIIEKLHNISKGVFVEEVIKGSLVESAGIIRGDYCSMRQHHSAESLGVTWLGSLWRWL